MHPLYLPLKQFLTSRYMYSNANMCCVTYANPIFSVKTIFQISRKKNTKTLFCWCCNSLTLSEWIYYFYLLVSLEVLEQFEFQGQNRYQTPIFIADAPPPLVFQELFLDLFPTAATHVHPVVYPNTNILYSSYLLISWLSF